MKKVSVKTPQGKVVSSDVKLMGYSAAYNVELFVARNWKQVFLAFLSVFIVLGFSLAYVSSQAARQVAEMERILHDHLNRVLVATPDGRIVQVARVKVNAQFIKSQIRNFISNWLIVGKLDFYVNDVFPDSFQKLLEENPRVATVLSDFTDSSEDSVKQMKAYWKYLYSLAVADRLPELVKPIQVEAETYDTEGEQFHYEGLYRCLVMFVDVSQSWRRGYGDVRIVLDGYFRPEQGSVENPYGLRIEGLKVEYVKK